MVGMIELLSLSTSEEQARWLAQYDGPRTGLVSALRNECIARSHQDPRDSLYIAQLIRQVADLWQDDLVYVVALQTEADARRFLGEHQLALTLYEEAVGRLLAMGRTQDVTEVAVGRIDSMMYLALYEEAQQLANEVVKLFESEGNELGLGKLYANMGNLYARIGRFSEAHHYYQLAYTFLSRVGTPMHSAMLRVNQANVLTELNDFETALHYFEEAQGHFVQEQLPSAVHQIGLNIAYLYYAQGEYQTALATFATVRDYFVTQEGQLDVALIDLHRSDIYLALNLWEEAIQMAQEARPVFESAERRYEVARLWLNAGIAYARLGQEDQANAALTKAQTLFTEERNTIGLAMADLYVATFAVRRSAIDVARRHAERAYVAFHAEGLNHRAAQCQIVLGEVALLEKDPAAARVCFHRALELINHLELPAITFGAYYGLGRSAELEHSWLGALFYYRQSITDIETLQTNIAAEDYKISFLSDKLQVYEGLVRLCLQIGTPEAEREAFATIERAKSRALLDTMARHIQESDRSTPDGELLAEFNRLKRELNWYYNKLNQPDGEGGARSVQQLSELTQAVLEREQEVRRLLAQWRSPELAKLPNNPIWTVTAEELQHQLQPDVLLLEYYTLEDRIVVFGVSAELTWSHTLEISSTQVAQGLAQLRFQMNKFSYGVAYRQRHANALQKSCDTTLELLYEGLIRPIQAHFSDTTTLIIVPHGILHYVPFHALYDGEQYLIDTQIVSYTPSATILYHSLSRPPVFAEGDPLIIGIDDQTIPYAQSEAMEIAELFPTATLKLGDLATFDSFQYDTIPAFLHLSTHATFRKDNPLFSALKLHDHWLTVNDIYDLNQSPPLVTLSACETGRHQIAVGDELVGLCRGFLATGAQSLVVSLWMVEDRSTASLMKRFYEQLHDGQPVHVALHTAQLAIKNEKSHPYYWAPFVVTGSIKTYLHASSSIVKEFK